ncbi:hypothetical protein [Marinobacter sp.]|uniref:hypothetical protein n=1 Tax=Marinobacter sp. TaxID=50741 RepID=UPI00385008B8
MLEDFLLALETAALPMALGGSVWAYPLVNAGHILGIALLVGGIVPLDLRLLGLWNHLPLGPFLQVLRTTAAVGLGLAVACGALLFSTAATEYASSGLFLAKMVLVACGILNAGLAACWLDDEHFRARDSVSLPFALRVFALASLCLWISVLFLGRLVGYF